MNQMFNENCEACVHNQSVNNTLLRLARLEEKVDELGSNNEDRLTDLEEALQVAYNRINKLEDYIAGIEEAASEADSVSVCDICCECTCEQHDEDSGVEDEADESDGGASEAGASEADQAEPLDEFSRNDDFVPVSYYEDEDADENVYVDVNNWETEDQVVPEMITVQFANQDEVVQFPSALHCQLVSSIPEDGHLVQAIPMCMYPQDMYPQDMYPQDTQYMHEQDMRLNYNPVLCQEEKEEEFPWNSQTLENGDLLYGTCSDEYEKYYEERTAAFNAAIDAELEANSCDSYYQFKALDIDRNNDLDERIAQALGQDPANEDDDDQEEYYNEEYINHNYSCHCNY